MLDKVAKLLAKAERTDNQNEADSFFEAAERLMIQHALSEDLIRSRMGEKRNFEITKLEIPMMGIFRSAELRAMARVAEAFRFKVLARNNVKTTDNKTADVLIAIGPKEELRD